MTVFVAVEHGRCEYEICMYLSSKLRLDIVPVMAVQGTQTISLKGSADVLREDPFTDIKSLNKYYRDYRGKKWSGRRLRKDEVLIFIIVDVDGDRSSLPSCRSGDLYKDSFFQRNVFVVVSDPNLDEIMRAAGFDIKSRKKPEEYRKVLSELESPDELKERLRPFNTDIPRMIEKLEEHCPDFQR